MKSLLKKFSVRKLSISSGLTLIELLVVVAILGILAAVLLAAVDPVQQQLKATDAVAENTAAEFVNANNRYFGSKNSYPWYAVANGGVACYAGNYPTVALGPVGLTTIAPVAGGATTCLPVLENAGELKSSFGNIDINILNKIYINQAAGSTSISACYAPQSKSGQGASTVIYNQNGTALSTSPTPGSSYYCAF